MAETQAIPVAVVGMACRLPGGIDSPEQLWKALLRGDDMVTEIPADRWDIDDYYDAEAGVDGRSQCKWGAFLDDVAGFDADFFGIGEREATAMDPQHRLLLETSWEAVEHAGLNPTMVAGTRTGVFVGLTHGDYQLIAADTQSMEGPYGVTGTNFSLASGRIAYALGVHGPAVTIDTACSSGLYVVHMACRSLNDGESDLALAGSACVTLEPRRFAGGSANGMLSPTGQCHAFDVAADGFVGGEGSVMVMLKRLPDALRDGDRVLAVIRGTAANQDGRSVTITTPSMDAQVIAYNAALTAADVDPGTVGMVEAHGPGTPVGDPLEYAGLAKVYGIDGPCALGSVKTNFGHTQSVAGTLSLVKTVLSLQHGVVPQNLHFTELPQDMAEIDTKLFVPEETTPWPTGGEHPRRAAVSSYGMSGTNVHAILEQAPETTGLANGVDVLAARPASDAPLMFPLSATSADALRNTAGRLADWVDTQGLDIALPDLGYTLARRRAHRPVRTAVFASTPHALAEALREVADNELPYEPAVGQDDRGPVWVFSGQGSQWARMGAELLLNEPVFAATVAQVEPLINLESGFSVTAAISAPETVTGIDRIQPALFTMQVALAATMKSYGVLPGAVIGHSMGEAAAAVVAGALSLEDGVRVICRRSQLMSKISGSGAMASVELPAQQVLSELMARGISDVVVAVVASPQSTVIGGETQTVRDLVAIWEQREVMAREVAVDVASHSAQVDPILDELADVLADITPLTPTIPYYSATQFDPREELVCDAWYWVDNLRHTVRFAAAVQAALEDGYRVFAELAPHPLLTHAVDQTARSLDIPLAALAAMRREQEVPNGLGGFLAELHSTGAAIDFSVLYPTGSLVDAPLPTWTHRPHLLTRDGQDGGTHGGHLVSVHPLMGAHVRLEEEPERHVWQAEVGTVAQPWLADHQIYNAAVLPAATYCEMALSAAHEILGDASEVSDMHFERILELGDENSIGAVASVDSPGVVSFAVETRNQGQHNLFATAVLQTRGDQVQPPAHDILALLDAHPVRLEGPEIRNWYDIRGFQYGPAFRGLIGAHTGETTDTVLAEVGLPAAIRSEQKAYGIHPALLDACFQSVAAHPQLRGDTTGGLMSPLSLRELRAYGSTRSAHYCLTRIIKADTTGVEADFDIMGEDGTVLLTIRGLQLGSGASEISVRDRVLGNGLLTVEWHGLELPEADDHAEAGSWLLISTSTTADIVTNKLTDALKISGADCTSIAWPQQADHPLNAERLREHLGAGVFTGVVVLTGPKNGRRDEESAVRGGEYVRHLTRIVRDLPEVSGDLPRLYLVTRDAQMVLDDDRPHLEQGGLRGLMRVISAEHPQLRATQIDLDEKTTPEQLARQLLSGSAEDETAWRDGEWYVARLCPGQLRPDERQSTVVDNDRDGMRLEIRKPGDLETMELVAFERITPGSGQIEVAVSASSTNFADVLNALGRLPSFDERAPELGMDFAGVVTAVGPDVTGHQVGDRVGGFSKHGCWATFVLCDARTAVKLPSGLTDEVAAAVSTTHSTAWYGLHELARISTGDRVLIHSATGGVGQAAIAIARAAGAEVFATAGSPERRDWLRNIGIEHVYDSHSIEFAEAIRDDTDGYGVDIVLNSLSGAAQRAGLELLSFGGRFVEIGKLDVYANSRLGLFPFRRNLTFNYVDLALMADSQPERIADLLRTVYQRVADGELQAPEITRYPLSDAVTAIRVMSAAEHTGKLVLDIPQTGRSEVVVPPQLAQVFRRDGSYIITGGLGGLGIFLAEKMVTAGCGRIVLTSRSQPNQKTLEMIELIRAIGADIEVVCGDIAEAGTAKRLVDVAMATGLPLRGVLHAAAVFENAMVTNLTDDMVDRNWAPKVYGAWNLHQATAGLDLDWFCLFSSAVALVGSPGQGAYAAANSWLDAFTLWRQSQGLPATSIAWALWSGVGAAAGIETSDASEGDAEGTSVADHWRNTAITPDEGAYAFEALLRHDRAYSGYAPMTGTPWFAAFAKRSPFAELFQSVRQNRTDTSEFLAELHELPTEEWVTRLRRLIADQVTRILRRPVDPDRPLSEYGVDSLGNLELRTHIESETGIRITSADITTVKDMATLLCGKLAPAEDASAPVAT